MALSALFTYRVGPVSQLDIFSSSNHFYLRKNKDSKLI